MNIKEHVFIHKGRYAFTFTDKKFPFTDWFFEIAKVPRIKTKLRVRNDRNIFTSSSFPESFFGIKTEFQDVSILMQS